MKNIWISTENEHKKYEFTTLLEPLGFCIHTPSELSNFSSVAETGTTFAENAILKAQALYNLVKEPVIADDSGIVVTALNGAPGIYSARYAGEHATDAQNRQLLLKNMENIEQRDAYFIAVIAIVADSHITKTFEGQSQGYILYEEQGENGFGYDNLFFSTEINKTFAEATIEEKNQVSHRARALQKMLADNFFNRSGGEAE